MKCPACNLINPDNAVRCVCGYDFSAHTKAFYRSITYMGVGEFFSNSWRTFGANWATFIIIAAIPTLVSLALELATRVEVRFSTAFIIWIVSWIVSILSTMALTMVAHKTSDGQAIGVWESYALSFRLFWRYIWTSLLYFLIVFVGTILLIIPGIIWGIIYVFAPYVSICEGISGKKALSRSRTLTEGRFWSVLWREIVFGLLFLLIIGIPIASLILLVGVVLGKPTIGFLQPNPVWAQTIWQFAQFIGGALFVIFNVLLLKSLREELLSARATVLPERDTEGMQEIIDTWRQKAVGQKKDDTKYKE